MNKKIRPYHFEKCDAQPDYEPCICDLLLENLEEAETDAQIDEREL